ncbi:MAG TPA: hypothetical protein VGJ31_02315, partial [Dongiaceae bacterium]
TRAAHNMKSVHQCTVVFNKKLPLICNGTAISGAAAQQFLTNPQYMVGGRPLYAVPKFFL